MNSSAAPAMPRRFEHSELQIAFQVSEHTLDARSSPSRADVRATPWTRSAFNGIVRQLRRAGRYEEVLSQDFLPPR